MIHPYIQGINNQVNNNEVIKHLQSALAEELISSFNYRIQARLIQGFHKDDIKKELMEHSREEDHHADLLMERIMELGGNPELRPLDWDRFAKCRYMPTTSGDQVVILEDAIKGERCAIKHYTEIAQFVQNKDDTTFNLIHRILNDEYEHMKDLNKLLQDVQAKIPNKMNPEEDQGQDPKKEGEEDENTEYPQ